MATDMEYKLRAVFQDLGRDPPDPTWSVPAASAWRAKYMAMLSELEGEFPQLFKGRVVRWEDACAALMQEMETEVGAKNATIAALTAELEALKALVPPVTPQQNGGIE